MAWTDANRQLTAKLEVQWDSTNWTDESSRLISATGRQAGLPLWRVLGQTAAGQPASSATFVLRSENDRYSPFNASGALYSYIKDSRGYGIDIRFSLSDDSGSTWERVFTGQIDSISLTSTKDNRASIKAMDYSQVLRDKKTSTGMLTNQSPDTVIDYLAGLGGTFSTSLDAGLQNISYAWLDDEELWREIVKVAQADGGRVAFDKSGTLTFYNAESWVTETTVTTSQHSFTVSRFRDISTSFDWHNVYTDVIVIYAPRVLGASSTVWNLPEALKIAPGDTLTVQARYTKPVISPSVTGVKAIDDSGGDLTASVSTSLSSNAQRGQISFTNSHSYLYANIVAAQVTGTQVVGRRSQQVDYSSSLSVFQDKTLRVAGNEYVQTRAQADLLGEMLRDITERGRTVYRFSAPYVPTLEPFHRVTLTESDSGISADGLLTGISWQYGSGAARATYEMIDASNWLPDESDYFTIDTDTLDGGKVAFY